VQWPDSVESEERKVKNFILRLGIFCFMFLLCAVVTAEDWKIIKGEHFQVYYIDNKKFAGEVLSHAEKYYDKIAADLGYSRYDNFWRWDNRAKIYLYRTHEDFILATGKNPWIYGTVKYYEKEIISYEWSAGLLDLLLPHEIAHLIFRDFVGFPDGDERGIPLWLDEGVAQWEEEERRKDSIETVKKLIREKSYIPIAELMDLDVRTKSDRALSNKFYAQAVTLVGYMIKEYGPSKFNLFCRQLRDGKSVNAALSFVYTNSMPDIKSLEEKWIKYYAGG